jgi:hypothetical protein
MLLRFVSPSFKTALFGFALIGLFCGAAPKAANATLVLVYWEYTGSFTGSIINPGPPVILLSSGTGSEERCVPFPCFGNMSFSHNTSIPNFSGPPFATQTNFNGALTFSDGVRGTGLTGSYTGTFQLFDDASGGTINLDLVDLIGSGFLLNGRTGSGRADGTVAFTPLFPPNGFDGTFDVTVNATLGQPLPAALPLFATGLGVMGLFGWRRKRKNTGAIAA